MRKELRRMASRAVKRHVALKPSFQQLLRQQAAERMPTQFNA
jgi:hypothetical protein